MNVDVALLCCLYFWVFSILKSCVRSGVPCYEIAWRGEEARQPATEQQPEATGATSSADRTCSSSSSAWMVSIERRDVSI